MISWIHKRLTERTTLDGIVLIGMGVGILMLKSLASIFALCAIAYGAFTVIKKEE